MPRSPWTDTSSSRQTQDQRALVVLVVAFLTVSWLPLSVRAWSAAWSGLHPVSVGQLVQRMTPPAMRPDPTSWRTPSK